MHRRLVYIYLLNVPSFSSRYFNKIKRTSRLGRLLALSLEILYLSINDFEILAEFNVLQNLHLCAQKSVCATNLRPFGEIGANFSLQLSS